MAEVKELPSPLARYTQLWTVRYSVCKQREDKDQPSCGCPLTSTQHHGVCMPILTYVNMHTQKYFF